MQRKISVAWSWRYFGPLGHFRVVTLSTHLNISLTAITGPYTGSTSYWQLNDTTPLRLPLNIMSKFTNLSQSKTKLTDLESHRETGGPTLAATGTFTLLI